MRKKKEKGINEIIVSHFKYIEKRESYYRRVERRATPRATSPIAFFILIRFTRLCASTNHQLLVIA